MSMTEPPCPRPVRTPPRLPPRPSWSLDSGHPGIKSRLPTSIVKETAFLRRRSASAVTYQHPAAVHQSWNGTEHRFKATKANVALDSLTEPLGLESASTKSFGGISSSWTLRGLGSGAGGSIARLGHSTSLQRLNLRNKSRIDRRSAFVSDRTRIRRRDEDPGGI